MTKTHDGELELTEESSTIESDSEITYESESDIDTSGQPQIRNLMNLFIFITFCGTVYLMFVYMKENKNLLTKSSNELPATAQATVQVSRN